MYHKFFTHERSIKSKYIDPHHVLKVQIAKRLKLDPYIYFNQIVVEHYFHINILHNNHSQTAKLHKQALYERLKTEFKKYNFIIGKDLSQKEWEDIKDYWYFCTIGDWKKEIMIDKYDEIKNAHACLSRLSKEIKGI